MLCQGWHGQALLVRAGSELVVANVYSPLLHADNIIISDRDRFITLAAYLLGLQRHGQTSLSMPTHYNPHSGIQNPQSPMRGIAHKEQLVGGKLGEIRGGQVRNHRELF